MNKKWELINVDEDEAIKIASKFNISKLVAKAIVNKGLNSDDEIEVFLSPRRGDFHDPFLMPDMEKAVDRVVKAIQNKEKVTIFGDYDVDGITSSSILHRFLKECGLETKIYIPNRITEGYGLNENAVRKIADEGTSLIITVDCGITGIEEVKLAKSLGIDTVVTDHHETGEVLPEAVAVVDCKRKDNTYPFNGLAGCGVAFKLAQGISKRLELPEEKALKYLEIVCVGTISDIVPLEDENRTISKLGLRLLNQTKNPGLKALIESTGYKKIDSTAVSFGLAPRINACGRMGHEDEALKLFLTDNLDEARNLTTKLNEYNTQRQDIEKQIFKEAQVMMENKQEQELPCIVLGGQNWHHGVIGIVSSKITDMYSKPSLLLCFEGEDAKGSGRSVQGFDLHEALENCKENIKQFGGHSMAVGLTIESKKFNEFKKSLENYAKKMKVDSIVPIIKIDQKIAMGEISIQDIKSLELLEPYGEANKIPIFQINNVKIESIRTLSEGKHLKLTVKDENRTIDCIGFNLGNLATDYPIGSKIDIIGNLEINEFRGIENIQVNLKDIRHSI